MSRFRKDNKGAILAWVIVLVMMFAYATIWFTAGWAALKVVDTVEADYELDSRATGVSTLLRDVFAWHPIIVFIGLLLYALVSSQRRDVRFDV